MKNKDLLARCETGKTDSISNVYIHLLSSGTEGVRTYEDSVKKEMRVQRVISFAACQELEYPYRTSFENLWVPRFAHYVIFCEESCLVRAIWHHECNFPPGQ